MLLFGLTGKARSGKDTAALFIEESFGFQGYSMADPIRHGLSAMLWIPFEDMTSDAPDREAVVEPYGRSIRQMLQTLGTEWGRNCVCQDIWLHALSSRIESDAPTGAIIRDIRFDNEAEWLRNKGGVLIQIERPGVAEVNNHVSESGVNPRLIDFTVQNDGTLEQFSERVLSIVADIAKTKDAGVKAA